MACPEATYAALLLLVLEGWWRCTNPSTFREIALQHYTPEYYAFKGPAFTYFSLACLIFSMIFVLYLYDWAIFKLPCTQNFLPYLYMFDSLGAVILGYSLYFSDASALYVSLAILTNFLMINVLSKVFAKKKPEGLGEETSAALKAIIHHISSFFFVDCKEVIVITTVWRAVSMTGHTAQALHLKKFISADQLYKFNWALTHARNAVLLYIVIVFATDSTTREGFARSAVGHVGYMIVRAGPVFRLGSVYVGDKAVWQSHTDLKRLHLMFTGYFPFITIEF
eukprot:gene30026-36264_t